MERKGEKTKTGSTITPMSLPHLPPGGEPPKFSNNTVEIAHFSNLNLSALCLFRTVSILSKRVF